MTRPVWLHLFYVQPNDVSYYPLTIVTRVFILTKPNSNTA